MPISTENIKKIQKTIAENGNQARLIAVSKTKPIELLQEVYDYGLRLFGENKVQEMASKQEVLPPDIEWHLIGHLQTNKVRQVVPFVSLIHSVDSLKLLQEINKEASKINRPIDCLLQMHIAQEETKFGFSETEFWELLEKNAFGNLPFVRIKGLMGMATNTDDEVQIRSEFRGLKNLFEKIKQEYKSQFSDWSELSMGMSSDYEIALEEGSTLIRVGSLIFGERQYV